MDDRVKELEAEVEKLRLENEALRRPTTNPSQLTKEHIERYSRQLLLSDGFGVEGQLKLLRSRVLIVGAGGIGSTAIPYLAAAGVGRIDVMDADVVEVSNLHRQVAHSTRTVGMNKATSACQDARDLNPTIDCRPIESYFSVENATLVTDYDCVVDCSDNPQTRYLLNDTCVLLGKPLVSASAIGTDGQLTVYNYQDGPCYRCLYPTPTDSAGCQSCSDAGVLAPVPGLVGVLQAVEVLKVLTGMGRVMSNQQLMYSALPSIFMTIQKPPKRTTCVVCGTNPTIRSIEESWESLRATRGPSTTMEPPSLPDDLELSWTDYNNRLRQEPHVLLDVRVKEQFELCALDGAVHIPLAQLATNLDQVVALSDGRLPVYCYCRRGINSTTATRMLQEDPRIPSVRNLTGGLDEFRATVDPDFPSY